MVDGMPILKYHDAKRHISKRILVENEQVTGVRLMGETVATDWLKEVMSNGQFTESLRRWALAPLPQPPTGQTGRGKIVCNCLDVAKTDIIKACQSGATLDTLKETLKCGTECGSCIPELKRLAQQNNTSLVANNNHAPVWGELNRGYRGK